MWGKGNARPAFPLCAVSAAGTAPAEKGKASSRKADSIMQKVFSYAEQFRPDSLQYVSDVYLRHTVHTKRRGQIVRYVPGMFRLERGSNDYLSELHLRLQHHPPGQFGCKIIAYNSTSRYQRAQRLGNIGRFNAQIYAPQLFSDYILNPLHKRNRKHYRYVLSPQQDTASSILRIDVRPLFNNELLVQQGVIEIEAGTGAVRHFTLRFRHHLQRYLISADMKGTGKQSLLPDRLRITSDFRLSGNKVNELTEIVARHEFQTSDTTRRSDENRYDLTSSSLLRIDTARTITDCGYFDSFRRFPLRKSEQRILEQYKLSHGISTQDGSRPPHPADSTRNEGGRKREQTQDFLLSSHRFNIGQHSQIKLPALITPSMIGWNASKGLSLQTKVRWDIFTKDYRAIPVMELAPKVGYSFKQHQVYWETPFLLRFCPELNGAWSINAGGGAHIYNNRQAEELRHKLEGIGKYDSLLSIIDSYGFHDYRDTYFQTDMALSPVPGLRLTFGARYHRLKLIEWNETAAAAQMKHHYSSAGPRVQIEWTPGQYYYRDGRHRIPLYSPCPTFLLSYERGYAIGRGQTHYERLESDIRYRLPLYAMRTLYFRMGAGFYTQRGNDCFLNYDYFRFSYIPEQWDDEMTGEFQLLSSRWYNESRYYVRFTGTYESPMLFFSRIPLLSGLVQKERFYLNMLTVKSLGIYSELGYAVSTNLLNLGAFVGIAPDHSANVGCKVVLKFFED